MHDECDYHAAPLYVQFSSALKNLTLIVRLKKENPQALDGNATLGIIKMILVIRHISPPL